MAATAELRTQARAAEKALDWAKAAQLWQDALDAYPGGGGQLAELDRAKMIQRVKDCRAALRRTD